MKRILIFTGSRSEYGLLKPLIDELKKDNFFDVKILASGTHLSPEFGLTYKDIIDDGFEIDEKVEMILSADTPTAMAKSVGLGIICYVDAINRINPDLAIVLGDRFEALSFAISCYILKIPLAHIHGGEITVGALDDGFRHAITKFSYIHFTSTEFYRNIVIQLGEDPQRVFNVGALAIDNIKKMNFLTKEQIEQMIGRKFAKYNFLVVYHPVTVENISIEYQLNNLFKALDEFTNCLFIFTKTNADADGRLVNNLIEQYVEKNSHKAVLFTSMGQRFFLSTLKHMDALIGNSSSGIIEAPSLLVPTVNIGERQKGRIMAPSVINCDYKKESIIQAINKAISVEFKEQLKSFINPYGDGYTAIKISEILKNFNIKDLKKEFYIKN